MSSQVDLSNYSTAQLRELQEQIQQSILVREQEELARAREKIMEIAKNVGVPLQELVGGMGKKGAAGKADKVPAKYRHPENEKLSWTGRGRQPGWVKEWVDGGKSIDELRV